MNTALSTQTTAAVNAAQNTVFPKSRSPVVNQHLSVPSMRAEIEQMQPREVVATPKEFTKGRIQFPALVRDMATMGGGTALAAVFNMLLVFLIPRVVSVEDFGYWRLFLLYASYAGFAHLGFADGALLSWVGRPLENFHNEIGSSLWCQFWLQLAVVLPACLILGVVLPPLPRFVAIAVLLFAVLANSATLLQYSLQGARQFGPVAIATAGPAGGFLVLTFLLKLREIPKFRQLIILYAITWAGLLVYLWIRVRPRVRTSFVSAWSLGKAYTLLGWPILLANTVYNGAAAADRLVVSVVLPIREFAQYSLAASTMFVPLSAIATVYRVFFSHVASVEEENRARIYAQASKLLLVSWSLLLPYYFVLEIFVLRFLPKYATGLPIAGILLLGAVFLADIQILHMSYSYLHGKQRQFLFQAIGALVLSLAVALAMTLWVRSLTAVAIGQVAVLALWWLGNEWNLRLTTTQGWRDWLRVLSVVGWSAASYALVLQLVRHAGWRIPAYYLLVSVILWVFFSTEFRSGWRLLQTNAVS